MSSPEQDALTENSVDPVPLPGDTLKQGFGGSFTKTVAVAASHKPVPSITSSVIVLVPGYEYWVAVVGEELKDVSHTPSVSKSQRYTIAASPPSSIVQVASNEKTDQVGPVAGVTMKQASGGPLK